MADNEILNFKVEIVTPILNVKDISISLAFYVDILGFKNAEWGDDNFTSINRDNTGLYLCRGGQGVSGTWIWMGFDGAAYNRRFRDMAVRRIYPKLFVCYSA